MTVEWKDDERAAVASIHKRVRRGARGTTITWQVFYREPGGKQRTQSFRDYDAAKAFRAEVDAEKATGDLIPKNLTTFAEVAQRWLGSQNVKPKTYADYKGIVEGHLVPKWGGVPIQSIKPTDVREFLNDKTACLSVSRAKRIHRALNSIATMAIEDGLIRKSFVPTYKFKTVAKREIAVPAPSQVAALADECTQHKALVLTLAYMGLRWAEAVGLRYRHIFNGRLTVSETLSEVGGQLIATDTKNHRRRVLPVPAFLIPLLGTGGPDDLVFTSIRGAPLRNGNFRRNVWKPATEALGLDLRPHDLRHFCASLLISKGATPLDVMAWMGHSQISVTMDNYGHLFEDALPNLAALLDAEGAQHEDRRPDAEAS